ncbi:MAG: hypothetical protein GX610_07040 [Rhodococcus sp.]|nr:hypothetical protein [Rhodococcus sp. (in: high G+C Gram-positive bacteria)]
MDRAGGSDSPNPGRDDFKAQLGGIVMYLNQGRVTRCTGRQESFDPGNLRGRINDSVVPDGIAFLLGDAKRLKNSVSCTFGENGTGSVSFINTQECSGDTAAQ